MISRQNSRAQNLETHSDHHTGLSLAFDDIELGTEEEKEPENPKTESIIDSDKSKGVVCVVSRLSAKGKTVIKRHAVQTSFFAIPAKASKEDKRKVDEKIKTIIGTYEANKYIVETHRFELPFAVDAICKVTKGYTASAKPLKVEDVKKRKRGADASDDDDNEVNEVMPKGKNRAVAAEPKGKKAKAV